MIYYSYVVFYGNLDVCLTPPMFCGVIALAIRVSRCDQMSTLHRFCAVMCNCGHLLMIVSKCGWNSCHPSRGFVSVSAQLSFVEISVSIMRSFLTHCRSEKCLMLTCCVH